MNVSRKFHLRSYGCQMNLLDSELVASKLVQAGYRPAENEDEAGILLFNTCSVRDHAENRVWSKLGALRARKDKEPDLFIGVLGCMAQEHKIFLRTRMPHVDLVCGTMDFAKIDEYIDSIREKKEGLVRTGDEASGDLVERDVKLRPNRAQAYVNIIRGCNMPCTYCIVPATRGLEVSRPIAEILPEVENLVSDGVTEITLLGQTVNAYGHDLPGKQNLAKLLRQLHVLPALRRINFITSHPNFLTRELMETMAELPRVSRYFHLPAQSGSNDVLQRMKRLYTREKYLARIRDLRELIPDMEFASDWIVGYPGETEEDHEQTMSLMEEVRFSQSYVFKYSPRPLTVADDYFEDDVPEDVKARRNQDLLEIQNRISREKNQALLGRVVEVLVEGPSKKKGDGRYQGRTQRNRIVHMEGIGEDQVGCYLPVRIETAMHHSLIGTPVDDEDENILSA